MGRRRVQEWVDIQEKIDDGDVNQESNSSESSDCNCDAQYDEDRGCECSECEDEFCEDLIPPETNMHQCDVCRLTRCVECHGGADNDHCRECQSWVEQNERAQNDPFANEPFEPRPLWRD